MKNYDHIREIIENNMDIVKEVLLELTESNKRTKRFTKPTSEDVKAYCIERKNNINAEQFIDFYESKGWKIGKESMKDWKAAVRTWEKRNNGVKPQGKIAVERHYSQEDLNNLIDDIDTL